MIPSHQLTFPCTALRLRVLSLRGERDSAAAVYGDRHAVDAASAVFQRERDNECWEWVVRSRGQYACCDCDLWVRVPRRVGCGQCADPALGVLARRDCAVTRTFCLIPLFLLPTFPDCMDVDQFVDALRWDFHGSYGFDTLFRCWLFDCFPCWGLEHGLMARHAEARFVLLPLNATRP